MTKRLIHHGELPQRSPVRRAGDPVLIEAVETHLGALGPCAVIHDEDSRWAHVDLFLCEPDGASYSLVATCGMAERPLTTVAGDRTWLELICVLPLDWPRTAADLADRENAWPFSLLRWLARFPHQTGTGYAARESVGPIPHATDRPRAHPFEGALLLGQKLVPRLAMVGREITFLAVCPIHADELAWIRRDGASVVLQAFAREGESPLLMWTGRPSYAPLQR